MSRRSHALSAALVAALLGAACSGSPTRPSVEARAHAKGVALQKSTEELLGPARYLVTEDRGASFDQGEHAWLLDESGMAPVPAVLAGKRVLFDHGFVTEHRDDSEGLVGFGSVPARFGGGYLLWSSGRLYRAERFLGELVPLADIDASGGIRPFLRSLLIRSSQGLFELEASSFTIRPFAVTGMADGLALDEQRAVRLDLFGRASYTLDGGEHWIDLRAERGVRISGITLIEGGNAIRLSTTGVALRLGRQGDLEEDGVRKLGLVIPKRSRARRKDAMRPAERHGLADRRFAEAVLVGARLPGERLLVGEERGLVLFSTASAEPLGEANLYGVAEDLAHCQPVWANDRVLAACSHERGGQVLVMDGELGRSRLEITFPEPGEFVTGPGGALGYAGPCGPQPASSLDLGQLSSSSEDEDGDFGPFDQRPEPEPSEPSFERPPDDEAVFCQRGVDGHWMERRLRGEDARTLYRWVLGPRGELVALVLQERKNEKKPTSESAEPEPAPEGVRVLRLDPLDPALAGGAFPKLRMPDREPPYRSIDPDFWVDEEGAIRGWVRVPEEGEESTPPTPPTPIEASAQGRAGRLLRVEERRGGRSAGIRVDAGGRIELFALPKGTVEVATGGRFGLAMAIAEDEEGTIRYFETLDGGRSFTSVVGPPLGQIEAPYGENESFGCSASGCVLSHGLVRLGWGSARPEAAAAASTTKPDFKASKSSIRRTPVQVRVSCRFDLEQGSSPPPKGRKQSKVSPERISVLRDQRAMLGSVREGSWNGELFPAFDPGASIRHLRVRDPDMRANLGAVVPVLSKGSRSPVDLLLRFDGRVLFGASSGGFRALDLSSSVSSAVVDRQAGLLLLDSQRESVLVAQGDAVATALRVARVRHVGSTRLTLGVRVDSGRAVLVGYSTATGEVFASDLDLGRAEIGPVVRLGELDKLAVSVGGSAGGSDGGDALRFVADLPVELELGGPKGGDDPKGGNEQKGGNDRLISRTVSAKVLLRAGGEGVRLEGVEFDLSELEGNLSARFGDGEGASLRRVGKSVRGSCSLR